MASRRRTKSTPNDSGRAIGYIRCSKDEQELGPEAQRAAIEEWCQTNGVELVGLFEEHISGAAEIDKRLELLLALDAIETEEAGILLVLRRDRLARDNIAAAMIDRLVQRSGGRVVSTVGVGNGEGPEAELMRGIIDLFSQYERQLIRARTRAGLAVKKGRGERVGRLPFGYQLAEDGVHVEPNPAEQEAIAVIVQLRAEGLTQEQIANHLNGSGVPSRGRRGEPASWHQTSIGRLLKKRAAA
jgi:site-specific DNA recombinase